MNIRTHRSKSSPGPQDAGSRRLSKRSVPAITLAIFALVYSASAFAQHPTASRLGDLQIGGGVSLGYSNYNFTDMRLIGGTFYTSFDVKKHWGGEFDFHQTNPTVDTSEYERTYEFGPRYHLNLAGLHPYGKAMFGRAVFNFHNGIANIAYNEYVFGGGADIRLKPSLNLRLDYEYQNWIGFPLADLHPSVATVGVAYHFHE